MATDPDRIATALAAARAALVPYRTRPLALPMTTPLSSRPPAGTKLAFFNIGGPVGEQLWAALQPVPAVLDVELVDVPAGPTERSTVEAADALVEMKPGAVIDVGVEPALFGRQIARLRELDVPVVLSAVPSGESVGIADVLLPREDQVETGRVLAAALVDLTGGAAQHVVFYHLPELSASSVILEGFRDGLADLAPFIRLRIADLPLASLGADAADRIVADLLAHPETDAFADAGDAVQLGLRAAQRAAGLDIPGVGTLPTPENFRLLAAGDQLGTVALDLNLVMWMAVDRALRELAGQPAVVPSPIEVSRLIKQLVTRENVPAAPESGYVALDDYQARFAALWSPTSSPRPRTVRT